MKQITYKKILVPHDGSRLASVALSHALTLAKKYDAEILLLQVIDSTVQLMSKMTVAPMIAAGPEATEIAEQVIEYEQTAALKNIEHVKKQLIESGLKKISAQIVEGSAGNEIVSFATRKKCDIIVMSTHGRTGLGRALLGSVADYVLRHFHKPVMLVRPEGRN